MMITMMILVLMMLMMAVINDGKDGWQYKTDATCKLHGHEIIRFMSALPRLAEEPCQRRPKETGSLFRGTCQTWPYGFKESLQELLPAFARLEAWCLDRPLVSNHLKV